MFATSQFEISLTKVAGLLFGNSSGQRLTEQQTKAMMENPGMLKSLLAKASHTGVLLATKSLTAE